MGLNTEYVQFYKPWFDGTPQNAKKATATLTFSDVVIAGETVTIGNEVYEFVADVKDIAKETNIPVVVGTTLTADNAVTKLALAINTNSNIVSAKENETDDTCIVNYNFVGTEGNSVDIATDCINATWGEEITSLSGGQFATPAMTASIINISGTWYVTNHPVDKWTESGWYKAIPALV